MSRRIQASRITDNQEHEGKVKKPGRESQTQHTPPAAGTGALGKAEILALQRSHGNAFVQRMLGEQVQRASVNQEEEPVSGGGSSQVEGMFGQDFSGVAAHQGSAGAGIGASAYTFGSNIAFGSAQQSQGLLGHEAAHVEQQREGTVSQPVSQEQKPEEEA